MSDYFEMLNKKDTFTCANLSSYDDPYSPDNDKKFMTDDLMVTS